MKRLLPFLALFAPGNALADPSQLRLVAPAEGFRRARTAQVIVVGLDAANALADAATAPVLTAAGATISPAAKIAPGLWRFDVTPSGAQTISAEAALGPARGALSQPVRAGAEAALEVTLSKTLLGPGERPAVTATVTVRDAAGAPVDGMTPSLESTAGGVSPPVRVGPGKFEAKLKLPDERYPQALQVVAFVKERDVAPARAVLVLEGRASIPITTKPKSKVTIRVGKRSLGPLVADVHGQLDAEIEASPSDIAMSVESVDEVGNKSEKSVGIDAPPWPRLWTRVEAGAPALDARSRVTVAAFLLDRRGRPVEDAKASAKVADETIKLASVAGLLAGESRIALAPGPAAVSVEVESEKKVTALAIDAAPPVAIAVRVSPEQLVTGGTAAGVSAELVDAAGRAAAAGKVVLSGEGVGLSDVQVQPGRATAAATLAGGVLPPNASVVARADGPGFAIVGRRVLVTIAGAPAKADVLLEPKPMVADGTSTSTLAVRFFDAWGNPVKGLKPTAQVSAGSIEIPSEVGEGTYRLTVRAPTFPGPARITIDSGAAHTETQITYLRPASNNALAAGAGVASNLGALRSELLWIEGRRAIRGPFAATLRVSGSTGAFRLRAFGSGYDVSIQQAVVMPGARWTFSSPMASWTGSAGFALGAGVAQVKIKGAGAPPGKGGVVTGARLCGTAERRFGGGALLVEAGYGYVTGSGSLVKNNVSGIDLTVGVRHGF